MAMAYSAIPNVESQRNLFKGKINLSNSLRFGKGRGFCVVTFQERYSDIKRMGDSEIPQIFTVLPFIESLPLKDARELHKP